MRTITLEEHFATPEFFDGPARFVKERAEKMGGRYVQVLDRLCDVNPNKSPKWMRPASTCRCFPCRLLALNK